MIYRSEEKRKDYFPPLLSNGDLSLSADCEGSVCFDKDGFEGITSQTGRIFRAGRRQSYTYKHPSPAPLLWWGALKFDSGSELVSFTHELNEENGFTNSICKYKSGLLIDTTCFVHQDFNLYAIRKKFNGAAAKVKFSLIIDEVLLKESTAVSFIKEEKTVFADFNVKAYDTYSARIALSTDKNVEITVENNIITFEYSVKDGDEICFYYILEDSLYCDNHIGKIDSIIEKLSNGFDSVFNETCKIWNEFHNNGYIKTEDEFLNSVYRTALYNLKCHTTNWSIAVGIDDRAWDSKFFAFDEYYSFLGLLEANKTKLAKRVPQFRLNGLKKAIERATDYSKNPEMVQAMYVWEAGEHGEELARVGFWYQHIFHMAVIALGAFEYYKYTNDKAFLEECYPMIKACAKFYTLSYIYERPDGNLFVGKCTDLERLGSSVENPFFTSCGVIKTLEVLVKASEILNLDEEYRKECEYKAEMLRKTLPHDGEKYVPFEGCEQKSMAVFSGKYPFDVISNDDPKLMPALTDFIANEKIYGNMYPFGEKMSIWYASWKAVSFARMGRADFAYTALKQTFESVGVFAETYEINEKIYSGRPWFSTAAGVLTAAVNEMMVQSDGENIYLLPAAPEKFTTVSFKLAVKGGAVVEAVIENNEVKKLDICFRDGVEYKKFNIYLRGKKIKEL
ncbi:MAG: hypothetical protein IJC74_04495 [Clostridia bacterium]|nr:hypothetical protein [Clostridia bacterium]